jgi:hypothetical protein
MKKILQDDYVAQPRDLWHWNKGTEQSKCNKKRNTVILLRLFDDSSEKSKIVIFILEIHSKIRYRRKTVGLFSKAFKCVLKVNKLEPGAT